MFPSLDNKKKPFWFVMRDLKRANTKHPAYRYFQEKDMEVFTPTKQKLIVKDGQRIIREVPCVPDLLFVHDTRENVDPIVENIPTIQYRWVRNKYREPMVVPDAEMERFIHAVNASANPRFYLPEEITPAMVNRRVRIVGGLMDGYEGTLVTVRGSKVKRLLIGIPNVLAVGVEVSPELIQLI